MNFENVLLVGAIIFAIGLYGALSKRSAITVLMSLELMFNAINITAVAVSRYVLPFSLATYSDTAGREFTRLLLTGQVFSVFIITVHNQAFTKNVVLCPHLKTYNNYQN